MPRAGCGVIIRYKAFGDLPLMQCWGVTEYMHRRYAFRIQIISTCNPLQLHKDTSVHQFIYSLAFAPTALIVRLNQCGPWLGTVVLV